MMNSHNNMRTMTVATIPTGDHNYGGSGSARGGLSTVTPLDLPRHRSVPIAIIDVDNVVIGRDGGINRKRAMQQLAEVYAQLSTAEVSLAVMSASCHEALGHEPWFRFPNWTWRVAEVGQDAADYQLLEFAGTALRQHPGGPIAVASGDGIFAALAIVAELEVVVPVGHNGVSHRLRHFLRVRGSNGAAAAVPAPRAAGDPQAASRRPAVSNVRGPYR